MLLISFTILGLVLAGTGWFHRWRMHPSPFTFDAFVRIIVVSFSVSFALVYAVFGSGWLIWSFVNKGGRLEDNFAPGFGVETLFTALVIGVLVATGYAIKGYVDTLTL